MKKTYDVSPRPAYLAACRQVLGNDRPGTVIGAIRNDPHIAQQLKILARSIEAGEKQELDWVTDPSISRSSITNPLRSSSASSSRSCVRD